MKKKLKMIRNMILYNWKPLVGFQIIYKAVAAVVFVPGLCFLFNLIMKLSGYQYLTIENIGSFIMHPLTIIAILILLFLAAFYAMIDIGAVIFALDQSYQKVHIHFWQITKFSVKNAFTVLRLKNIMLCFVILLLVPLLNIGLGSGMLTSISIPEFIMEHIESTPALNALFIVGMVALFLLMARWIYAFHYFTLERCSFRVACKKSTLLGRKRRVRDFITIMVLQLMVYIICMIVILSMAAVTALFEKVFAGIFVLKWLSTTVVGTVILFTFAALAALSTPIGYSCISALFYIRKEETKERMLYSTAPNYTRSEKQIRHIHRINVVIGCIAVCGSLIVGYFLSSGKLNPQIEYVRTMEVTAHRGASVYYPENTMSAFEGAKELGADWIELDVQQTKDGKIIVLHDTNLKRTTGVDANTWEMNYEEISGLDAGSFFDKEYAGESIPLLSEVAEFAKKEDMKLNIELKPTGYENDFEKNVVDIISQYGIEDSCVITSQVYEVLENVKAYNDKIETVYVMSIAYGDINQLDAADHFSVEATNVSKSLVARVHNAGKELYVWTVNTEENMNKMIDLNVDNIITDDITLAKQCIYESRYSNILTEFLEVFQ